MVMVVKAAQAVQRAALAEQTAVVTTEASFATAGIATTFSSATDTTLLVEAMMAARARFT